MNHSSQYSFFSEIPTLTDHTIMAWMDTARRSITEESRLRQDAIAMTVQALTGLWQIFCRQGSIPAGKADAALATLITPFNGLKTNREFFDAGHVGLTALLENAGATTGTIQERGWGC